MTKSVEHTVKFPALESRLLRHIQIKLFLRLVGFESQAQRSRNFLNPLVDRNIVPEVWMVDIHHNVPGVFFSDAVELLPELNFPLAFPRRNNSVFAFLGPPIPSTRSKASASQTAFFGGILTLAARSTMSNSLKRSAFVGFRFSASKVTLL